MRPGAAQRAHSLRERRDVLHHPLHDRVPAQSRRLRSNPNPNPNAKPKPNPSPNPNPDPDPNPNQVAACPAGPGLVGFFTGAANIIDIVAIVPWYIELLTLTVTVTVTLPLTLAIVPWYIELLIQLVQPSPSPSP